MPTTQIELDYRDKSFDRVIDRRHWKEGIGMGHETGRSVSCGIGALAIKDLTSLSFPAWISPPK
jgi:hypothetical protein